MARVTTRAPLQNSGKTGKKVKQIIAFKGLERPDQGGQLTPILKCGAEVRNYV